MIEFHRKNYEGSFRVQMAIEPEKPEGVPGYFPKWYTGYVIEGLLLEDHHLAEPEPTMGQYVICQETGTGFMKYGFYRRVFLNSLGVVDKDGSDEGYINIWTGAVDRTCDLDSIRYCVQSQKAWFFAAEDLVKIEYFLGMEAYKIYCREWNAWQSLHKFTNKEVGFLEVSVTLLIHNIVYVYLLIINVF